MISILPMTESDISSLVLLEDDSFGEEIYKEKDLESMLNKPYYKSFVLRENQTIEGFILSRVLYDEAEIFNICIGKDYRGKGLSHKLLNYIEEILPEEGAQNIFLELRSKNEKASNLYRSHGFELIGKRRNYYRKPDDDAILMKKIVN